MTTCNSFALKNEPPTQLPNPAGDLAKLRSWFEVHRTASSNRLLDKASNPSARSFPLKLLRLFAFWRMGDKKPDASPAEPDCCPTSPYPSPNHRSLHKPMSASTLGRTPQQSTPRDTNMASLETMIARLEAEATRTAAREEPTTAHCTRKSYDQICEEIIDLKRRLKESNQ